MNFANDPTLWTAVAALVCALVALRRRQGGPYVWMPRELAVRVQMESALSPPALPKPMDMDDVHASNESEESKTAGNTRVIVDSLTLLTCYRYLFGVPNRRASSSLLSRGMVQEEFLYLSGVRVDRDTFVISHLLPVEYARQHVGGVEVAQGSNIELMAGLDEMELPLIAHCHSHPGSSGAHSTHPSATDRRFQASLERGGCRTIGLIFARSPDDSAYVRFFAGEDTKFEVEVHGALVEQTEEKVFRLSLDNDQLPLATIIAR